MFCVSCGAKLLGNAQLCSNCGIASNPTSPAANAPTQTNPNSPIKTPLVNGETLLVCQKGTIMKGMRVSGQLALTSQRIIWEKGGLANVLGFGLLSLAGTDYLSVPTVEITQVSPYWIPAAAGIKFMLRSGEELKFQLNGKSPSTACNAMIGYLNQMINR